MTPMMEDNEMNEIAQQSARIRDCFLDHARQYLLAASLPRDEQRSASNGARTVTQALERSGSGPLSH